MRQRLLNLKMKNQSVEGMIKTVVKGGVFSSWIPSTLKKLR